MEKLSITELVNKSYNNANKKGFYDDIHLIFRLYHLKQITTEEFELMKNVCIAAKLKRIVSEVSECYEALQKGDDDNFNEELADTVITCFSIAGSLCIDLEREILKKVAINEQREYLHGKRF